MNKRRFQLRFPKIICLLLLSLGGILIGLSLFFDSMLAFFGGCVFVFWGSIMTFISSEGLIKLGVSEAISLTYMSALAKAVRHGSMQNMIYTPPGYLNLTQNYTNRIIQPILNVEYTFRSLEIENVAPDNELFNLLEQSLGKSFFGMGFSEFEAALPKLLVESLEMAEDVKLEANGDVVRVILKKPFDKQIYLKAKNQAGLINMYGFPLSAALAYALAYSSGIPVMINRHLISQEGEIVVFEFNFLGSRSVLA
jgi:hypothetical protein